MGLLGAVGYEPVARGDPMIAQTRPKTSLTVAISASESPDIAAFGLSEGHLRDALADLALRVLAADMDLAYGGDLRDHGLTRLLFELVMRYTPSESLGERTRVTNHLAWPVHIGMPVERIEGLAAEPQGVADLVLVGMDGARITLQARRSMRTRKPNSDEWVAGLTAMRRCQRSCNDARIVLGGQVAEYKGCMPDVAEEAILSIQSRQPLFLVGGFGGSARDVAETLGLADPWTGSRRNWCGQPDFQRWTGDDLNNGLSREENERLATTPFLPATIVLVLRGLCRLRADESGRAGETAHA